jgi:DNA-directed RNA polymerase subunit RPC12/RpoP
MGNCIKYKKSIDTEEIIECPICLDDTSNYITLKCGHKFDHFCIQMYLFSKNLKTILLFCPYCRTKIDLKTKTDILKRWIIINYNFLIYEQKVNVINNKLNITKINKININNINFNNNNNTEILLPLYNYYKPGFLISPIVDNFNILYNDSVIELSNQFNMLETDYNEKLCKLNMVFNCNITDIKWYNFLLKLYNKLEINDYNKEMDFIKKLNYSKYKIIFYIDRIENVKTIDNYNKSNHNKMLFYKDRKFQCIFKLYIYKNDNNFFLINKLYAIIYI